MSKVSSGSKIHQSLLATLSRRAFSPSTVIRENDVVFIADTQYDRKSKPIHHFRLTPPLQPQTSISLARGSVLGSDIIGKTYQTNIPIRGGTPGAASRHVAIQEASLASFVVNRSRLTTPIFPQDASLIVSLLDINLPSPGEDPDFDASPPYEIFEAGTGAGSLTIHLARAIHGANPPLPPHLRDHLCSAPYLTDSEYLLRPESSSATGPHPLNIPDSLQTEYDSYLLTRRAIIHTLDVSPVHSRSAHSLVRQFRRAQYLPDVTFHTGTITSHLSTRLAHTNASPFLAHAILDLPSPVPALPAVSLALRPNGLLVVFQPSISQLQGVSRRIRDANLDLRQELVVELPESVDAGRGLLGGTGGREWDLRSLIGKDGGEPLEVCRPRVGGRVGGGGFVAVYRKMTQTEGFDVGIEDL